jgi:hypothetical protein
MSVWANGYCQGIGTAGKIVYTDPDGYIQNWLYILYDPEYFAAGLNIGYKYVYDRNQEKYMEVKPSLFAKFFNNILNVGATAGMQFGFSENSKAYPDAPFNFWYIEPQVRANINSNFYIAAVYRYTADFMPRGGGGIIDVNTHWFNLRICYTF